ncbi:MAG: protoporphyrinogen oxidase [Acidimicrobiales bacterium]
MAPAEIPGPTHPGLRPRVVIVGGGITGLAAAWELRHRAEVTVLEADVRTGGKILTGHLDLGGSTSADLTPADLTAATLTPATLTPANATSGSTTADHLISGHTPSPRRRVRVECGPDTFLARQPDAVALCEELGLGANLVAPANGRAWIWSRGLLTRLPEPHVMGLPLGLRSLARSRLVSRWGMVRGLGDLVLGPSHYPADPTIAQVVGSRMGPEILDRLVEPLVGGINAGLATELSLAATAPPLAQAAARGRSLLLALRQGPPAAPDPAARSGTLPVFMGLAGGLESLPLTLAEQLAQAGVSIATGAEVVAVELGERAPLAVRLTDGGVLEAEAVVLAIPAHQGHPVLAASAPRVSQALASIDHASVSVVTLAYRPDQLSGYLNGAGFLVPRVDGRLVTACTWMTSKWPELRRSGHILLRASCGRAGDVRHLEMTPDELTGRVHRELARALGISGTPVTTEVTRWNQAFPQYRSGHSQLVDRAQADLGRALPGVWLAGCSYRGLGIAACIRQGREAGRSAMDHFVTAAGSTL